MENKKILILYGSATGNSEYISKRIYDKLNQYENIELNIGILNDYEKLNFFTTDYVIILVSTTGNGDFTQNSEIFGNFISKKSLSEKLLQNINFTILGN
jgi:flavodoxin